MLRQETSLDFSQINIIAETEAKMAHDSKTISIVYNFGVYVLLYCECKPYECCIPCSVKDTVSTEIHTGGKDVFGAEV